MQSTDSLANTLAPAAGARSVAYLVPALLAAFLGLFLTWGVGFSQISPVHNAGHDARHTNAFPCH